ncbi:MAG: cytochrome c oxidase subunit II [Gemmatimonas sp.]|nr:cytochrome c oxidase subunit II [Gemmatimonas sp.]
MSMLRLRQAAPALAFAVALLTLSACSGMESAPNSTFNHTTDLNTAIDGLWDRLLLWGTIVFVVVEAALVYTIFRFRKRPGGAPAKQIHGNVALEITWTAIPALILVLIAVPTVKTIFQTQAPAPAGALTIEVTGHQWWWEFHYPEYGVTTANEVYVPVGRTANFVLRTKDVLHSFWVPQMGGKRDLISNKTNVMWFTPNPDLGTNAYNGFCLEYCGASHANMKFRMFTVQPDEFASWAAHQARPALPYDTAATAAPAVPPVTVASAAGTPAPAMAAPTLGYVFPASQLPEHVIPQTPLPARLQFDDALLAQGDAKRGETAFMMGGCIGCHAINGNPMALSNVGPNLTHFASRHTLGGGLFPNDDHHLARWIKNAKALKPGAQMNVIGIGEYDPILKGPVTAGLTDAQIADVVAYLRSLK